MHQKDNAYCGYNVSEAERYGLIKAVILNQIRWYLRTLGKQFDGQKCWRSVKDLADDIGLSYNTVKQNLPTEEMGIKRYAGYIPGTLTKTTWWEECSLGVNQQSESASATKSKELAPDTKSFYNRRKKEENPLDLASPNQAETFSFLSEQELCSQTEAEIEAETNFENENESFSSCSQTEIGSGDFSSCSQSAEGEAEAVSSPDFYNDVVDLKRAKPKAPAIGYGFAEELLRAAGKQDKAGGRLITQLRKLNSRYTKEELMKVARNSRYDQFWAKASAISLFSEAGVGAMLNKDNKVEDEHPVSHDTGIRRMI